jgi:glucokinase
VILAGDIGGTKTHLALYEPGAGPRQPVRDLKRPSHEYPSLESLVSEFLGTGRARPTRAVFGIAGPVFGNRCEATNLPWIVSGAELSAELGGAAVTLMNDLETTAWGVALLGDADFETLQHGAPAPGNRALLAAGTGLGEAVLVWDGRGWRATASEGGHADFAPRDPLEDDLLRWMRGKHGRMSWERALSGRGLADLYRFFAAIGRGSEPPEFAARFAASEDPAAEVSSAALDGSCERARLVVERFVEIYGSAAGNLALTALAVGGVYVGGGIAPRLLPILRDGRFVRAFNTKGRLSPMLEQIPIAVILDDRTALWGAAAVGLST